MEKSAKDFVGFFLKTNLFCDEYMFRVYEGEDFIDYKICAEEIEVSFPEDNTLSLYENDYRNRIDENSEVLGNKVTKSKEKPVESGYFLYDVFKKKYWFRVYGEPKRCPPKKHFKDYEVCCDMEVKIESNNLSFFEDEKGNRLSWASRIFSK